MQNFYLNNLFILTAKLNYDNINEPAKIYIWRMFMKRDFEIFNFLTQKFYFLIIESQIFLKNNEKNHFSAIPKQEELTFVFKLLSPQFENLTIQEAKTALDMLKVAPKLQAREDVFFQHPHFINTLSGAINVKALNKSLYDSLIFKNTLNFCYIQNISISQAPNFKRFLETSLDYATDPRAGTRLMEIVGYCISNLPAIKKGFFLIGKPSSGKSVVKSLLEEIIGECNFCNISLNALGDRFNTSLLRLPLCLDDELPPMLKNIETFKAVTSGSRINGEVKGGKIFTFKPRAKLLFMGNALPTIKSADGTDAFAQRVCLLYFPHTIPDEERDRDLLFKLLSEKDKIFSLCVQALSALISRDYKFTETEFSQKLAAAQIIDSSAIDDFINLNFVFDPSFKVHSQTIKESWSRYCKQEAIENPPSFQTVLNFLIQIPGVQRADKPFRLNGSNSHNGFLGLTLRNYENLEAENHDE